MLWMLFFLLLTLVLAATVMAYVAYPRRGEEMPYFPQLGVAMKRGVAALPTMDNLAARERAASRR
ncbi:MAG: hypothetical protein ACRDPH_09955 [Marmoricola sp.]